MPSRAPLVGTLSPSLCVCVCVCNNTQVCGRHHPALLAGSPGAPQVCRRPRRQERAAAQGARGSACGAHAVVLCVAGSATTSCVPPIPTHKHSTHDACFMFVLLQNRPILTTTQLSSKCAGGATSAAATCTTLAGGAHSSHQWPPPMLLRGQRARRHATRRCSTNNSRLTLPPSSSLRPGCVTLLFVPMTVCMLSQTSGFVVGRRLALPASKCQSGRFLLCAGLPLACLLRAGQPPAPPGIHCQHPRHLQPSTSDPCSKSSSSSRQYSHRWLRGGRPDHRAAPAGSQPAAGQLRHKAAAGSPAPRHGRWVRAAGSWQSAADCAAAVPASSCSSISQWGAGPAAGAAAADACRPRARLLATAASAAADAPDQVGTPAGGGCRG